MDNNSKKASNLTENFKKQIFEKSFDLGIDYSEVALDTIISDSVLKEIPIIKSLVSFYNISSSIVARHNVKKIAVFFQEFQSHSISKEKLANFKTKLENDHIYKNRVLETILVLIEKFIDIEKSKILANLLHSYIEGKITWDEFKDVSFVLNNLNPSGYAFLGKYVNKKYTVGDLIENEATMLGAGMASVFEDKFRLSHQAIKLYEHGIKPITNNKINIPADRGDKR